MLRVLAIMTVPLALWLQGCGEASDDSLVGGSNVGRLFGVSVSSTVGRGDLEEYLGNYQVFPSAVLTPPPPPLRIL